MFLPPQGSNHDLIWGLKEGILGSRCPLPADCLALLLLILFPWIH